MAREQLSRVGEIVRRHDPDRFFTALFAPAMHRETLFTLYAFNHELARATEVGREPIAALIRLQWWREVVEGARRRHEVAGPVGEALDSGRLLAGDLMGMIDGRELEVESLPDASTFTEHMHGTAGGVMVAAAHVVGHHDAESVRGLGAAYGAVGLLWRQDLDRPGGRPGDRRSLPPELADDSALRDLVAGWLGGLRSVSRSAVAAVLPAVFARCRLRRGVRPVRDRVMVLRAALTCRV